MEILYEGLGTKGLVDNKTDGIKLFKVNNVNTRTLCEICSKLTLKTSQPLQWRLSGALIINFE